MAHSKSNPNLQKGAKNDVANYRPISNLCSTSNIVEKLILNRIMEIQKEVLFINLELNNMASKSSKVQQVLDL
jgi:hypothetical protein